MLNTDHMETYWKNIAKMPFLLSMFCYASIVGGSVLLVWLFWIPSGTWEINGRAMSSAEIWSSGRGVAIAASLLLFMCGVWGLVARKNASRWLLVFSPFSPYIFLAVLPSGSIDSVEVVNAALSAAMFYFFFFRIRAIRDYFDDKDIGT